MKHIPRRILAAVLCMMMVMSTLVIIPVWGAETDPKKIDKFVIDFRTDEAFHKESKVYHHTPSDVEPDPNTGGVYSFDTEKQAMRVHWADSTVQNPIRLMLHASMNKNLANAHKYMVMVYSVKTTAPYRLSVWNSPKAGVEAVVVENGKDTGGKFVISEPVDVGLRDANNKDLISRWVNASQNCINLKTDDKNTEFYIKEIGFFKSEADAKAYYAAVDLSKPSATYAQPTSTTFPIDYVVVPDDNAPTEEGPSADVEPVVWSFEDRFKFLSLGKFTDHTENTEGEYEFVKLEDGTGALKLKYSPYGSFAPFRTMPAFHTKGTLTANHRYMRVTFMTDDKMGAPVIIFNNLTGLRTTLVEDAAHMSKGEFVTTNPVRIDIDPGQTTYLQRYINGIHCTIEYNSLLSNSNFYLKEIAFFGSEKQAYDYYGDSYTPDVIKYSAMTFGDGATGEINAGDTYGNCYVSNSENAVKIEYALNTNMGYNYMAKLKLSSNDTVAAGQDYIRVLYKAKNPAGVEDADLFIRNDKVGKEVVLIAEDMKDTDDYVLSDAIRLPTDMMGRFAGEGSYSGTLHNSFFVNTRAKGGEYCIKAVYFFSSREAAEAFEVGSTDHNVTIAGNDIAKYQIVVGADYAERMQQFAGKIQTQISALCGAKLPIVTDEAPASGYEILIGKTNRAASAKVPTDVKVAEEYMYRLFWINVDGNNLVLGSVEQPCIEDAVTMLCKAFLYENAGNIPADIAITEKDNVYGTGSIITLFDKYEQPVNQKNPVRFTEDFDTDEGYFTEEDGTDNWTIKDGKMSVDAKDYELTFIHVYEKNTVLKASLTYKDAAKDASFGIMSRYNAKDAYIKAGYDFEAGEWYIESRDGYDFYIVRNGHAKADIKAGETYTLELVTDGKYASLTVNGKKVIDKAEVTIVSPGRAAIYAKGVKLTADNVDLTLTSGQGTIWRNVEHTILPVDGYLEGGTVTEMKDGSLLYLHQTDNAFTSTDNGKTWTRIEKPITTYGYVNLLRLDNGDLMLMKTASGKVTSITSSDDGKTWVQGGTVCVTPYPGTTANAGNMNDKLMQVASGRIYYGMNYESVTMLDTGRRVFCEFYFTDDYGKTWTKSDTDSWEIEGNEKEALFGECKLLECADGTVRMYNSWNQYGCLVYSDSTDGGKTFGPLQKMEDFKSPHSSMQFVRDVYAENDTTYYMVWVDDHGAGNRRSALSLAISYDGKEWHDLGDVWRWECTYSNGSPINHVVDPFVKVTEDYILCGSGFSQHMKKQGDGGPDVHQGQRQNIYAIKKDTLIVPENLYKFTDVSNTDTFYDAVKFAVDEGLFNGTSETTFEPYTTMNRSMFVTVLGRLDKADVSKYTTPTFSDVKAGQWYTSYVEWAAANGIVNGMGDGTYGINGAITAEQACTILYRYADGKTGTATGKTIADYTDGASVSSWAKDAVEWAVANGIYDGAAGSLEPQSAASRALVAEMFANYVKAIG